MRNLFLVAAAVALQGCISTGSKWDNLSQKQRIAELDRISAKCGIPRSALILHGGEDLEIKINPETEMATLDCALERLKALRVEKMGFVGKEAYQENER